jgi:hypothetical protein
MVPRILPSEKAELPCTSIRLTKALGPSTMPNRMMAAG